MSSATRPSLEAFQQVESPSIDPDEEDIEGATAGEYDVLDYPDPISHGQGVEFVINDIDERRDDFAYRRLWRAWRDRVGDPSDEPYVVVEDVHERLDWLDEDYPAHLVLASKGWKVGTDTTDGELQGQRYEYSLQVARYDPAVDVDDPAEAIDDGLRAPVSWQTWVQPQNEDLVYKDGNHLQCHYGEGTKFRTQTTYCEASEVITRTIEAVSLAFDALGIERPEWEVMNRESWRQWKGEVHHRIPEDMMSAVVERLRSMQTLVEFSGDGSSEGDSRYRGGTHVKQRVVSDMWDRIGFAGYAARDGYQLGLKVYRVSGNPQDERLKQPKLEAFFSGTDGDTRLPHVDEWTVLRATLRQLANTVAIRCGIEHYRLQPDDYYQPDEREMVDTIIPKGWRQAMREANEERERRVLKTCYSSLTLARWDVLWVIATLENATYDQLVETTGYSRDYIREIVAEFVEEDVLRRTTYPRLVVYHNEELRLNMVEKLQEIEPDRDLQDIREDADDRREERREQRTDDDQSKDAEADEQEVSDDDRDDVDDDPDWVRVNELNYSAADIGRYLERGDIEPEDAKIRISGYRWLG